MKNCCVDYPQTEFSLVNVWRIVWAIHRLLVWLMFEELLCGQSLQIWSSTTSLTHSTNCWREVKESSATQLLRKQLQYWVERQVSTQETLTVQAFFQAQTTWESTHCTQVTKVIYNPLRSWNRKQQKRMVQTDKALMDCKIKFLDNTLLHYYISLVH